MWRAAAVGAMLALCAVFLVYGAGGGLLGPPPSNAPPPTWWDGVKSAVAFLVWLLVYFKGLPGLVVAVVGAGAGVATHQVIRSWREHGGGRCGLLAVGLPWAVLAGAVPLWLFMGLYADTGRFRASLFWGSLLWCISLLAACPIALLGIRRGEKWWALKRLGLVMNAILILPIAVLCGLARSHLGEYRGLVSEHRRLLEQEEQVMLDNIVAEKIQIAFVKTLGGRENFLTFKHATGMKITDPGGKGSIGWPSADKWMPVGTNGTVFVPGKAADATTVTVAWPEQNRFEVVIAFSSEKRRLLIEVADCADVEASREREVIALPADLPPGKHRLVIRGRCP